MNKFSKTFIIIGSIAASVPLLLMVAAYSVFLLGSCSGTIGVEQIVCADTFSEKLIDVLHGLGFILGMFLFLPGIALLLLGTLLKKSDTSQVLPLEKSTLEKFIGVRKEVLVVVAIVLGGFYLLSFLLPLLRNLN
ncbi:hypothetical protein K2X96_02900 [Patescibacteria group bacterium]|nr:hypothetical protein [Patescibacteria group bacterium]